MEYDANAAAKQLQSWLEGKPVHDTVNDQCCPDFSGCVPELLAPFETRKAFVEGDADTRMVMLSMFLGGAVQSLAPNTDVYVTDDGLEDNHEQ